MTHLDYLNQNHPVRKSEAQKESFRKYIVEMLAEKGIDAKVQRTSNGKNNNIVIGDPTTANAVFTAHYDTPASSLFPNIMIPKNRFVFYAYQFVPIIFLLIVSFALAHLIGNVIFNDSRAFFVSFLIAYYGIFFGMMKAFENKNNYNDNTSGVATVLSIIDRLDADQLACTAFILFDNEEKGKKGSQAYFKDHRDEMKDRFLINFDCVGNGDNILFIAQKDAVGSNEYKMLENSFCEPEGFYVEFLTNKQADSNSDHKSFPKGVACVACKKHSSGLLYTPSIHTNKDIVADNGNVDFLSKNIVYFIDNLT